MTTGGFAHPEYLVDAAWVDAHKDDANVVVIDGDVEASFVRGHIPGAVSFTGAKSLAKQLSKANKDILVVAYCGGPTCNAYKRGASVAAELGFKNVKHLSAGISGWIKAGKKLEKN